MSIIMLVAKVAMIGAMFGTTPETFIVSTFMLVRQLLVVPIMRTITVILIIVRKCGDDRCAQQEHSCSYQGFS